MSIVGRLDQYASIITSEFDEISGGNVRISGLGTYFSSEFSENVGVATTIVANVFSPYDTVYDDFGGTLFGFGQGRYMRQNTDKSVIVYNEIDEITDYYGRGIVRDGMVLDLDAGVNDSYPGSGIAWTDLSPYNNNGTLTNGPTYSSSNGGFISFDGTDDRVIIPTISLGNGNIPWTCTAWVRTTSNASTLGGGSVLSNSSGGPVYSMMGVNSGKIVYWTYQNSAWAQKLGVGKTVNDGIWHFLSWVNYNNYTMDMYVDGLLDSNVPNSTSGNNNPINIIGASWAAAFSANIAQVSIYNRALTASEIKQNYDAIKGRFGLV